MKKNTPQSFAALSGSWTVKALNPQAVPEALKDSLTRGIPASVPGEVTLDMLAGGLIEEPFDGANETTQQWIGDVDWQYQCVFDWQPNGSTRYDLVAYGLDTVAALRLNGRPVGHATDFYQTYRWDIKDLLVPGNNVLTVDFTSPVRFAQEREQLNGYYPHTEHHPFNQIRKPSYSFGWDWGIDVANAGIWQQIGIDSWSGARIESVIPLVDVREDDTGLLTTTVRIERDGTEETKGAEVPVSVVLGGYDANCEARESVEANRSTVDLTIEVPDVHVWWPVGLGEAALYDVSVSLGDDTEPAWSSRVGFRTVSVDTAADEVGRPFQISVNGVPVHAHGYNWIPDDAFISRVDDARYRRGIEDLVESNSNMVRVWGGGIYEADTFYDLCDENGIMVWQDFTLACAAYDETPTTRSDIEAEVRQQITRLSSHPSLVVWNGSNENYVAYSEWGGFKQSLRDDDRAKNEYGYGEKPWGDYYYSELFPQLLEELNPTTVYLASSPMSFSKQVGANLDTDGTIHIWDVWNREDYRKYAEYTPRFADEFGYQAPPAWSTLEAAVHDETPDPFGTQMLVHQKASGGNYKLARGMRSHLTPGSIDDVSFDDNGKRNWLIPSDAWQTLEDWHWACQLQQAHAIDFGVSHMRSLEPINAGTLIWQLNDSWPVVSWAAVDYNGHRKPLWYASKRFFAPRYATIQPRISQEQWENRGWEGKRPAADQLALVILNDTQEAWSGTWSVERQTFAGDVAAHEEFAVSLEPGAKAEITLPASIAVAQDSASEVIVAQAQGYSRVLYNFADVIDQKLDSTALQAQAHQGGSGKVELELTATSYVRDVFCMVDKIDAHATVNNGLVSLLAGETATITVECEPGVNPQDFLAPNVLRSANELKTRSLN